MAPANNNGWWQPAKPGGTPTTVGVCLLHRDDASDHRKARQRQTETACASACRKLPAATWANAREPVGG
ncbi:hypothetical protein FH972_024168 [Carpinus fangiana]|uniref:Uncharacterized protein n=1 Tax=Carpinus fangiana TaxID=176857 RepID=A0A5N6KXJ6_9ROSI|nr:hypothetical protein FH972_024168 [Carpinus fangiana]